jgi:hypothetical protein
MFSFVSFFNAQSYSYCSVMSSESRSRSKSIFKSIYTFKKIVNVHVYAHVKIHVHVRDHVHINIHASCPCLVHTNIYVHVHFHVHVHWHVQWIDVNVQYMNMHMLHILCSGPCSSSPCVLYSAVILATGPSQPLDGCTLLIKNTFILSVHI